ncbi:MAG: hypothetical protein HPM95_09110 [Alphaproteobacteria bacterium]|nr:hypothetical protein [Alphaproteobacteria bacterium]
MIDEIAAHVWPTLQLTLLALATAVILAIPLGILMAWLRGRRGEALVQAGSVVGLHRPAVLPRHHHDPDAVGRRAGCADARLCAVLAGSASAIWRG